MYDLALNQAVFERIVARAQSSARTAAVFGAMFGVEFNEAVLRDYEVVNTDPFSAAVGTLIEYDPLANEFEQLDPETVLESALETDQKTAPEYQNEVLDKEPGRTNYMENLSSRLIHQNRAAVVDCDTLGALGEFFRT